MIKISRPEAYSGFDETDFKVIDSELDSLFHQEARNGRDMTIQYYLKDEETIILKVYWDKEEVAYYSFDNKGVYRLNELKKQAIELRKSIKRKEKEIDNPALTLGILSELDFFIDNIE